MNIFLIVHTKLVFSHVIFMYIAEVAEAYRFTSILGNSIFWQEKLKLSHDP